MSLLIYTVTEDVRHLAYNVSQIMESKTMWESLTSDHAKKWKAANSLRI